MLFPLFFLPFFFFFLKWWYNFMKMPLFGKSKACMHCLNRWVWNVCGWMKPLVVPSFLSEVYIVLGMVCAVRWFQEQAENSSALGPTPRTHTGAKSHEVDGLDLPSQVSAVVGEHPPGESCQLPRLYVECSAQHKETEQKSASPVKKIEITIGIIAVSMSAVFVQNSALFYPLEHVNGI